MLGTEQRIKDTLWHYMYNSYYYGPRITPLQSFFRPIKMTYAMPQKFLSVSHHKRVCLIDIFLALIFAASGSKRFESSILFIRPTGMKLYTQPLNVVSRVKICRAFLFHFFTKLGR